MIFEILDREQSPGFLEDKRRFAESTVVGVINEINDLADVLADHVSREAIQDQHIHLSLASERLARLVENMKHNFYSREPRQADMQKVEEEVSA